MIAPPALRPSVPRLARTARAGRRGFRSWMTGALAAAILSSTGAGAACADGVPRRSANAPTRIILGTTIVGDSDPRLWRAVLDLLPSRPHRIEVLDLESLSAPVQAKLRGVDGFVLAGHAAIVVIRQGETLRRAALGDDVDRLALASLVWHEMAHARGEDETAAFAAEEALWSTFVTTGRVASEVGMAYVARLREVYAHDGTLRRSESMVALRR